MTPMRARPNSDDNKTVTERLGVSFSEIQTMQSLLRTFLFPAFSHMKDIEVSTN